MTTFQPDSGGSIDSYLRMCQQVLQRVGVVHDPFRSDVTARWSANIVALVREVRGEAGVQTLLSEVVKEHLPDAGARAELVAHLRDEHGWLNFNVGLAIGLRASILLDRSDVFRQAGFLAISDRSTMVAAVAPVLSLGWLYGHVAAVNDNLNTVLSIGYDRSLAAPGRAVIYKKNLAHYASEIERRYGQLGSMVTRCDCEGTEGILAAVPLLFGREPAVVAHHECEARGDPRCVISVEWQTVRWFERILLGVLRMVPQHARLLGRAGQMEAVIRDRTDRLEEAHGRELQVARRLAEAEVQVRTGKAYAASAAHDINNALGPARSGIEEILRVLREARPAREEHQSEAEAAEADFARQLGKVVEVELAGIAEAFERATGNLSRSEAELLLDRLEFLARVSRTMREAIPDIYRGINRASDYTSFMSEMARVDYAQEREAVRLDELLGELVEKYRRLWERQGIELEQELSGEATVLGWRHVLESVFSNLLDNAAKALQENEEKRVRVVLSREGERCVVAVEDTGPGIPEELREKVFELGYTTHPADGKGFGLAYVKNYVTLLGGRVSAEDRPEGGAAFVVQIPVSEAAEGTGQ